MRTFLFSAFFYLLVAAVAVPDRFNFGIGPFSTVSVVDIALLMGVIFVCARFLFFLSPVYIGPSFLATAVLLPVAISILSIIWASDKSQSLTSEIKYVYSATCYFIALQFGRGQSKQLIVVLLVMIFFSWLAGSVAMYLGVPGFSYFVAESVAITQSETYDLFASIYTRLGHPYIGQSNDYGPPLALLGFVFLGYARFKKSVSIGVVSGLAFGACFFTFSRGLIGALIIGGITYALLARVSIRRLTIVGIGLGFAIALGWLCVSNISIRLDDRQINAGEIVGNRLNQENIDSRLRNYRDALKLVVESPLLGYGAGFRERTNSFVVDAVHNAYLEQWKYFGLILGTITSLCYVAIAIYFFRWRIGFFRSAALTDAIACGWLVLLISSTVETFFEATVPRALLYFILGLCVCLVTKSPLARATNEPTGSNARSRE